MSKYKLVASSRPGEHKVKIYCRRYTKVFVYARVRKTTFVEPTPEQFMESVYQIAHNQLKYNAKISKSPNQKRT